ncbi:hypothetical protein DRN85_09630 [Methanosarcinales archaeon]|nr:MAG: hypothetical protein DRN85_09630 [Methanosarcinales archaeon]
MIFSKEEIRQILEQLDKKPAKDLESETLEFKEWIREPKKLYKTLSEYAVCFANNKGGTIVLGVRDNVKTKEKAITGCGGYNINEIKSRIYESTDPKILVNIEELHIPEFNTVLLIIHIPSGVRIHTTTDGTAKIRIGKECKPMTGSMRQRKMVELGLIDVTSDVKANLTISHLSSIEIERLRNIIKAKRPDSGLLKLKDRELLEQTGITKDGHPTIAGILLVGKDEIIDRYIPTHEVVYLYMKNDIEYEIRRDYKNSILYILDDVANNIEARNRITTIKMGLFHFEIKEYPEYTYREAILNALLHRDYSEPGAVFFRHYSNRMEFSNPGGFIGGITPKNILRQDSKPRNRHLAEILRKIGLIEKAGMGVKRMFYTQLASGKPEPLFYVDEHNVRVIIRNGTIDEPFIRFIKEMEQKGKEMGLDELMILSVLRRQRELSITEAGNILQLDINRAREILNQMITRGFLEKSGIKKGVLYRLSGNLCKKLGESLSYIREKGIDEIRHPELILQYVKEYGEITNRQVRELLGVDKFKASRILRSLVKDKKLKREGYYAGDYKYVLY